MGSAGDNAENWILDAILGDNHTTDFPSTVYMALYTASPTDGGGGTEVGTTGTNYARVAVTNNSTNFPAASGSQKSNGAIIQFNDATGDWGVIVAWGLMSASSGAATPVLYGDLDTPKTISSGMAPFFNIGDLVIGCD